MLAKSIIFAAVLQSALSLNVRAETLTLACKFKTHAEIGDDFLARAHHPYTRVDQIVVDTGNSSFELRVANTIGTSHEEVYSYKGLDSKSCLKPHIQSLSNGCISGSQQCGAPVGFFYCKALHQFMLSELAIGGVALFVWDCE